MTRREPSEESADAKSRNARKRRRVLPLIIKETMETVYAADEHLQEKKPVVSVDVCGKPADSTHHVLIVGDSTSMPEIASDSVHLMVTSPPYFNAPFDYKGLF